MKVLNLTGRMVVAVDSVGQKKIYLPEKEVARANTIQIKQGEIDGIELVNYRYEDVRGIPEPEPDTYYIVSYAVHIALNGTRPDVISPDTSQESVIRDEHGRTMAVKKFRKI